MTKSKRFKWLRFAVLGTSIVGGPTLTAGAVDCPAFTAEMADAALLSMNINGNSVTANVGLVFDDRSASEIFCTISDVPFTRVFQVFADPIGAGVGVGIPSSSFVGHHVLSPLTDQEFRACRSEVLKSFAWKQYCAPALP